MSSKQNGQRTRAAVLDLESAGVLDAPVKRALRQTRGVGREGTGRKVARRSAGFREALAKLPPLEAKLAEDAARDWIVGGLLADAILELLEDMDVRGPLWRRLFDAYTRLMRIKSDRREELRPLLAKLADDDDPIGALLGARR